MHGLGEGVSEALGETDEAAAADEIPEVFREVFFLEQALAEHGIVTGKQIGRASCRERV